MYFLDPSDPRISQLAHNWIRAQGEVYVDAYAPFSGAIDFLVDSTSTFDTLFERLHTAELTILRARQYPLRGVVNEAFLQQALALIADDEAYEVISVTHYPDRIAHLEEGRSHVALRAHLHGLDGTHVGVGPFPPIPSAPNEVAAPDVIITSGTKDTQSTNSAPASA